MGKEEAIEKSQTQRHGSLECAKASNFMTKLNGKGVPVMPTSAADSRIAGFHTFLVSGSHMGGVLGGFDRDYSQKHFAYERVIVASLDHAIRNHIDRVHYSLVDNFTKLRLVECLEPSGLYFYSRNPVNRTFFRLTYKFNDVYGLRSLEVQGLSERPVCGVGEERVV